jgi:hypothetical protein
VIWNHENCAGSFYLQRHDEACPERLIFVVPADKGFPRYFDARENQVILKPLDRSRGVVVIEDDTSERQEALRDLLLADRWQTIQMRSPVTSTLGKTR